VGAFGGGVGWATGPPLSCRPDEYVLAWHAHLGTRSSRPPTRPLRKTRPKGHALRVDTGGGLVGNISSVAGRLPPWPPGAFLVYERSRLFRQGLPHAGGLGAALEQPEAAPARAAQDLAGLRHPPGVPGRVPVRARLPPRGGPAR